MSEKLITVRPRPCPSCPYRRDVPSGIWSAEEYEKLITFDGSIGEQAEAGAFGAFHCHTTTDRICAGWAGCHDMDDNLAVRMHRNLDPKVLDYVSPVPLFASGAEAAEHGKRDILHPGAAARRLVVKIMKVRGM